MRRRALLQCLASAGGVLRLTGLRAWAQTAGFPADQGDALQALAGVVLPSEIGAAAIAKTAHDFERWVREYRPGAEMDHGYGFTRLRTKPPSPAPVYLQQLAELHGVLVNGGAEERRQAVQAALEAVKAADLPRTPSGQHVALDLMSFYFRGGDANDLCYRAAIGRDQCRGLPGSENPPAPLKGRG